jgi:hypothetical protein
LNQQLLDTHSGAARHQGDVVFGRRGQCLEDERAARGIAHVDAVQGQNVDVDVQPQAGVKPLHERDRGRLAIGDARERQRARSG